MCDSKKPTFIFDNDGTLTDSYTAITNQCLAVAEKFNIHLDKEYIRQTVLQNDLLYFFRLISDRYKIDYDELIKTRRETKENLDLISPMKNCVKMLEKLQEKNCRCFVYTHRGETTDILFNRLGLNRYFEEIVNSTYGFKRKPSAEAIEYLVEKYDLDRENTYYVGDRRLDIECGKNGHIKTIFLKSAGVDIDCTDADIVIDDLMELTEII